MKFTHFILGVLLYTTIAESQTQLKHLACYWDAQSHYRTGDGHFSVENIDPNLCTHIIYGYANVSDRSYQMISSDPELDYALTDNPPGTLDMYRKTVELKMGNLKLNVLISVGGPKFPSKVFSDMAATFGNRKLFITSALKLIETFKFDGLDIDWEFPTILGGDPTEDIKNFMDLIKELSVEFKARGLILTAVVGNLFSPGITKAFEEELGQLNDLLDIMHVKTFDYQKFNPTTQLPTIFHHSRVGVADMFPEDYTLDGTIDRIVPYFIFDRVSLGIPTYGRTFTLKSPEQNEVGQDAQGPGAPFEFTNEPGIAAMFEICLKLAAAPEWQIEFDSVYRVPFGISREQWIGFDSPESAIAKVDYAKLTPTLDTLAGITIWSLDLDDCKNFCGGWEDTCFITQAVKTHMAIVNAQTNNILESNGTKSEPLDNDLKRNPE